jgi:hypothetical protein
MRVLPDGAGGFRHIEDSELPGTMDTLLDRLQQAFAANSTYLGVGSPTAAQTTGQVQRLTREMNAVLRLLLGAYDSATDT